MRLGFISALVLPLLHSWNACENNKTMVSCTCTDHCLVTWGQSNLACSRLSEQSRGPSPRSKEGIYMYMALMHAVLRFGNDATGAREKAARAARTVARTLRSRETLPTMTTRSRLPILHCTLV